MKAISSSVYLDKTATDIRKENSLLEELVHLAEERNIASFPPKSSGIPGKLLKLFQKKNFFFN